MVFARTRESRIGTVVDDAEAVEFFQAVADGLFADAHQSGFFFQIQIHLLITHQSDHIGMGFQIGFLKQFGTVVHPLQLFAVHFEHVGQAADFGL